MKIALVQLDAKDTLWSIKFIPNLLDLVNGVDLVVFPECMPFDATRFIPIDDAIKNLIEAGKECKSAFIAGGYVIEDNTTKRNAVFLVHKNKIKGTYFKRRPWQDEDIKPGSSVVCFQWDEFSCIPLICADAADNPSQFGTKMMYEAIERGAGKNTPIVVCSYGSGLNTPDWQEPLQSWSSGCEAPVLICGVSGKGAAFKEDNGDEGFFGGGGSGVFWPERRQPYQKLERGIYIIETERREITIPKHFRLK